MISAATKKLQAQDQTAHRAATIVLVGLVCGPATHMGNVDDGCHNKAAEDDHNSNRLEKMHQPSDQFEKPLAHVDSPRQQICYFRYYSD